MKSIGLCVALSLPFALLSCGKQKLDDPTQSKYETLSKIDITNTSKLMITSSGNSVLSEPLYNETLSLTVDQIPMQLSLSLTEPSKAICALDYTLSSDESILIQDLIKDLNVCLYTPAEKPKTGGATTTVLLPRPIETMSITVDSGKIKNYDFINSGGAKVYSVFGLIHSPYTQNRYLCGSAGVLETKLKELVKKYMIGSSCEIDPAPIFKQ